MKPKRAKPVLAWTIKTPRGRLLQYTERERSKLEPARMDGDKIVRVEIRELPSRQTKEGGK